MMQEDKIWGSEAEIFAIFAILESLYLTQREMMETSQIFNHNEISPRTIIIISKNDLLWTMLCDIS